MKNKLIHILEKFDQRERNKAKLFLKSPYFNKKQMLVQLFEALNKQLDASNGSYHGLDLKFPVIPRVGKLSDQQKRLIYSELFKLLEKFAALEMLEEKPSIYKDHMAGYYQEKKHEKLLQNHLNRWEKAVNKQKFKDESIEEEKYKIELHKYEYALTKSRSANLHLQEIQYSLDRSYYARKLKQACFALSHKSVYNVEYDLGIMNSIIRHILQNEWQNVPAIGIYYYCYLMLNESEKESHFISFKQKLESWSSYFPQEELRSLYLLAINYCIKRLNNGDLSYGVQGMDLYDDALKHKALLVKNNLSRFTYRNMCRMAIRTGDFDRAEKLSQEYKSFLSHKYKESAYQFNLAMIYYEKGDLGEALEAIQKVDFKDPLFNLAAKTIQLKIYYELNEEDLLDFHLEAMKIYLIRKKVLGYHKENYQNIIYYTRKLMKTYKYSKEKRDQLKSRIQNELHLTEKDWLLKQF